MLSFQRIHSGHYSAAADGHAYYVCRDAEGWELLVYRTKVSRKGHLTIDAHALPVAREVTLTKREAVVIAQAFAGLTAISGYRTRLETAEAISGL